MSVGSKVHSRSGDPWKLCGVCVAINYTPLSMTYYAYDSTADFLSLECTVLICKNSAVKRSYVVLEILNLNQ